MARVMKAAIVRKIGEPLTIENVPMPSVGPGDVLVKIAASGVCHTDIHLAMGNSDMAVTVPRIVGHEGVGVVCEIGQGVTSLKIGDRVGVPFLASSCSYCNYCTTGRETSCDNVEWNALAKDGCYAEYVVQKANYANRIPDNLAFEEAAPLLCAGVTAYKAIKESNARPGQWVAIIGIGGLGHLGIQYAKAMGIKVVAIDIRESCLDMAKAFGADMIINAAAEDPVARVLKEIQGVEACIIMSVATKSFTQGFDMLKKGGTAVFVGLPKGKVEVNISDVVFGCKVIKGSLVGTRADMNEALQFAADGKVKVLHTVDRLENINAIFDKLLKGQVDGRIVLKF